MLQSYEYSSKTNLTLSLRNGNSFNKEARETRNEQKTFYSNDYGVLLYIILLHSKSALLLQVGENEA
jgi:hypothetical protein